MNKFNLSDWALKHRSLVWYFMIMFAVAGAFAYLGLGREEDPSFTIKTMVIQAQWPGASAAGGDAAGYRPHRKEAAGTRQSRTYTQHHHRRSDDRLRRPVAGHQRARRKAHLVARPQPDRRYQARISLKAWSAPSSTTSSATSMATSLPLQATAD